MKRLAKEPLIHFLGGALMVFGFFWATGTNRDPADYAISIDESDIGRMKAGWEQNFRRPPSQQELDGLIDQEITEEIYYREALRLGMDQGDAVIRRRLFTKMRFLNGQDAKTDEPSDATLREWMEQNPAKYSLSSTFDFDQIYLGQIGEVDAALIDPMISQLHKGSNKPADVALPISLPARLTNATTSDISRQFGEQFAVSLGQLKAGQWTGPVPSGFGQHLIKITAKSLGTRAALDDVRQSVTNDWRAAQNAQQERAALESYRSQYEIKVAGRK